jgi:serine protease Do
MIARFLATTIVMVIVALPASAQISANPQVLAPFKSVVSKVNESTVQIYCSENKTEKKIALGTIVYADGYILTKASELRGDLSIRLSDGTEYDATVVGRHKDTDLALLHIEATELKPVVFSDSEKVPTGNWLVAASPANNESEPRGVGGIGIVSVKTRKLSAPDSVIYNHNRGYLGIELDEKDAAGPDGKTIGAKVSRIRDGGAKKAGLKANDVIIEVDEVKVAGRESLQELLDGTRPNQKLNVTFLRDGEKKSVKVTLEGPGPLGNRGDIQNAMGGDLSGRRTGFPSVLQTDMVIEPKNCGGPIVDLDGKVLGISIARAGRVETWILPSETIRPLLADLKSGKLNSTSSIKSDK